MSLGHFKLKKKTNKKITRPHTFCYHSQLIRTIHVFITKRCVHSMLNELMLLVNVVESSEWRGSKL